MSKAHIFNEILMARPEVIRIGIAKYMHGKSRGHKSFILFYQKQTIFQFRSSHNPHACLALLLEARSGSPTTLMAE